MILTGGASRRMGRNKLHLEIDGETILARVRQSVSTACDETILVGAGGVPDTRPGKLGPLAGLEAGLAAASHPLVFVAAGDMPFLNVALIEHLTSRLRNSGPSAVVPRHGGRPHPLCAAYRRDLLPEVSNALDGGVRAVKEFLDGLDGVEYVERLAGFGDPEVLLMNVNSPRDLERARAVALGELG